MHFLGQTPLPSATVFTRSLPALLDRGGHRDRADHVLAGFEGGDGHGAVVWYRRVDVDKVNLALKLQEMQDDMQFEPRDRQAHPQSSCGVEQY